MRKLSQLGIIAFFVMISCSADADSLLFSNQDEKDMFDKKTQWVEYQNNFRGQIGSAAEILKASQGIQACDIVLGSKAECDKYPLPVPQELVRASVYRFYRQ